MGCVLFMVDLGVWCLTTSGAYAPAYGSDSLYSISLLKSLVYSFCNAVEPWYILRTYFLYQRLRKTEKR